MTVFWRILKAFALAAAWLLALQLTVVFHLPGLLEAGTGAWPLHFHPQSVGEAIQGWSETPSNTITWSLLLSLSAVTIALVAPRQRKLAMWIIVVTVVRHLIWRACYTLDFDGPASAIPGTLLFLAEIYGAISLVLGCIQMYKPVTRRPPKASFYSGFAPTVDILIPTYSEPIEVLVRTITGCMHISYPGKRIYVLDDGRRPEVQRLCERLGCQYISRKDNRHAKAGNLNHALPSISGELVVVFDADHVPLKTFLQRTVPYFIDPKLAFVQTPQHFCTPDPFQRNLMAEKDLENEQDLFYHVIMPGMDHLDAVTFAGSGTLFRRAALDEVDGFAVETVTEDLHTGLRLHNAGWKSLYVNEDLASGLAPETFEDFLAQRVRWCQGAIQIFRLENPLKLKSLSWSQKLSYFNALWYFFQAIPRLIFLCAPLIYLLFGVVTIHAYYLEVMSYYLCYFIVSSVGYTQITGNFRQTQWSELYETALSFHLAVITVLTLINPYKASFKVTPKGKTQAGLSLKIGLILPHALLLGLCVAGLGMGVVRAHENAQHAGMVLWNFFWTGYNMLLLLCAILSAVNRPQKRNFPRIKREIPVAVQTELGLVSGHTLILSQGGATVLLDEPIPVSGSLILTLNDEALRLQSRLTARVVHSGVNLDGRHQINVRFLELTPALEENLIRHTFTAANTWEDYHRITPPVQSIWNLLKTPMRWLKTREQAKYRFAPRFTFERMCAIADENNRFLGVGRMVNLSESGARLELPANLDFLPVMRPLKLHFQWDEARPGEAEELLFQVVSPQQKEGNMHAYGVVFPSLSPEQHQRMVRNLYQRQKRAGDFVDVQEARRRFSAYLAEHWHLDFGLLEKETLSQALAS